MMRDTINAAGQDVRNGPGRPDARIAARPSVPAVSASVPRLQTFAHGRIIGQWLENLATPAGADGEGQHPSLVQRSYEDV